MEPWPAPGRSILPKPLDESRDDAGSRAGSTMRIGPARDPVAPVHMTEAPGQHAHYRDGNLRLSLDQQEEPLLVDLHELRGGERIDRCAPRHQLLDEPHLADYTAAHDVLVDHAAAPDSEHAIAHDEHRGPGIAFLEQD